MGTVTKAAHMQTRARRRSTTISHLPRAHIQSMTAVMTRAATKRTHHAYSHLYLEKIHPYVSTKELRLSRSALIPQ